MRLHAFHSGLEAVVARRRVYSGIMKNFVFAHTPSLRNVEEQKLSDFCFQSELGIGMHTTMLGKKWVKGCRVGVEGEKNYLTNYQSTERLMGFTFISTAVLFLL